MSTRNILFDSPALHSLKRAQLVKLCKKYNLKASGKNTELVKRLKQHAHNLPQDADMTTNVFSEHSSDNGDDTVMDEDDGSEDTVIRHQRPSEMWEVVMDDIPEEDSHEMQQGTLRSKKSTNTLGVNGEFGLGGSSMSTVTTSLKAFASSLGLKRSTSSTSMQNSTSNDTVTSQKSSGKGSSSSRKALLIPARDSLLANAIPYSSIPASTVQPQTEPFTFSYTNAADTSLILPPSPSNSSFDRPIPGASGREGVDASIITGTGVEGTIRLITTPYVNSDFSPPKLQPFKPSFDLIPPTPGKSGVSMWPASPGPGLSLGFGGTGSNNGKRKNLYPDIEAALGKTPVKKEIEGDAMDVELPGSLPPVVPDKSDAKITLLSPPRPEPFIFGSPHPRYSASKKDFSAAAQSVLAEMNARLASQGVKTLNSDVLSSGKAEGKVSNEDMLNYQFGGRSGSDAKANDGEGSVKWKFDRAHEKEFSKMAGIDQHYAAKRVLPSATQEPLRPLPAKRKRKSNALGTGLGNGLPSTSTKQQRRGSNARVISAGTRKKMALPGAFGDDENDEEEEEVEERETKRVCAQVDDGNGVGGTVRRVSIVPGPAPSRRTSGANGGANDAKNSEKEREAIKRMLDYKKAKRRSSMGRPSLVAQQKQKAAPSRFGFLTSAKSIVKAVWNRGAGGTGATSSIPVAKSSARVASSTSGKNTSGTASGKPPIPDAKKPAFDTVRSRASANSRAGPASRNISSSGSGLLKPGETSEKTSSIRSVATTTSSNNTSQSQTRSRSPIPSFNVPGGSLHSTNMNTRNSSTPSTIPTSSIRTRRSVAQGTGLFTSSSGEDSGNVGSMGVKARATRPSSTLHAPTKSSLAKVSSRHPASLPPLGSGSGSGQKLIINGEPSLRGKDGVTPSPSKIPLISPLSIKPKSSAGSAMSGKIFSTPFVLPTSPEAERAIEIGNVINPITGIASPVRPPLANSDQNRHGNELGTGSAGQQKVPSLTRKPRISRSKVIAKLGAQRATFNATGAGTGSGAGVLAPHPSGGLTLKAKKGRTRSSYGVAAANRKSIGGRANRASGAGAALSAKKRARQSEYARRRSTRIPVA